MSNKNLRIAVIIIIAVATVALAGIAMALFSRTIAEPWTPLAICATIAAAAAFLIRRIWPPITGTSNPLVCFAAGFAVILAVTTAAAFGLNYHFADPETVHKEYAVIEKKYREKHYHKRRLRKGVYVNGEPYYTYGISIRLPDGSTKKIDTPLKEYNRLHKGDSYTLTMARGLFGLPVIKSYDSRRLPPRNYD